MAAQSYANHAHRPRLSGVAGLFTLIAMILFAVVAVRQPSLVTFGLLSLSIAVATLVIISRVYIVSLQDRIIRTEMHARLLRLGRDRDLARLSIKQVTALRFASDAELPALLDKALAENLSADSIKRAVVNWQADDLRT